MISLNSDYSTRYSKIIQGDARISGVLLHPTSLPSGKIDEDAFRWMDFMKQAGLQVWQVLPLGVPQENFSPYQCYSAFAMNPALLETNLYEDSSLVRRNDPHFKSWYQREHYWLDDYALFMILKKEHSNSPWFEWPTLHKYRDKNALEKFRQNNLPEIMQIYWQQYELYSQWAKIKNYAEQRDIYLFGDMPIFVAHDSADVWAFQDYFQLDEEGMPIVVAGVPPDYFSTTGQRWGNPHYDWDKMEETHFDWWVKRLKNHLQLFDLVRIDHFRGLEAVWSIDASEETAINGEWIKVPGGQLLQCLQDELGDNVPIVAEDLGIITPEVEALRKKFKLPGMSVLQFSFDQFQDNPHKPQNITHDRVVYTGTHDNDTSVGWFNSLDEQTREFVLRDLQIDKEGERVDSFAEAQSSAGQGGNSTNRAKVVTQALIDCALQTEAQLAIIPLQDFLNLTSEARMNTPGTMHGNWQWRFDWDDIPQGLENTIRQRITASNRGHVVINNQ